MDIKTCVENQRAYFNTHATLSYAFRFEALTLLKRVIQEHELEIMEALKQDLGKVVDELTGGEGVNVIFEAAGVPALLKDSIALLSPAGRLVAMTYGPEPVPVDFRAVNAKELTILGTRHQYQKFPEVVTLLPDHLRQVDRLTTHIFPAEEFERAFAVLADKDSGAGKVVLTF